MNAVADNKIPVKDERKEVVKHDVDVVKFIRQAFASQVSKNTELIIKAVIPNKSYRLNFYTTTVNPERFIPDIDITKSLFIEIVNNNGNLDFVDKTNVNPRKNAQGYLKDK